MLLTFKEIATEIIKEIQSSGLVDSNVQIINGYDLFKIPESVLTFPRMIVYFDNYNDSEYDYSESKYNEVNDSVDFTFEKIPRLLYSIKFFNDINNGVDILQQATNLHRDYSNPYKKHLDGSIQIIHTGSILDVKSPVDYDYIEAYQFSIEFDMSEKTTEQIDYADHAEFSIENKLI